MHFRKSHVCANEFDVQETDFSFTQFAGLRMDGIPALTLWDLVIEVFSFRTEQHWWTQERERAMVKPVGSC